MVFGLFGFDIPGFGSKRRTAIEGFGRTLTALEVNPAYVDNGMRFLIYKWAEQEEAALPADDAGAIERRMTDAAALISYCVLGAAETETLWGTSVRMARQQRFETALASGNEDDFDVRLIKLILAKGVVAPDIAAVAQLSDPA
jgi:hypothetical protein